MSQPRFCSNCGTELIPNDKFCGGCGIDLTAAPVSSPPPPQPQPQPRPQPDMQSSAPRAPVPPPDYNSSPAMQGEPTVIPGSPAANVGGGSNVGSKNALIIMVSVLVVLFAVGGGLYWWLSKGEEPKIASNQPKPTTERQRPGVANTDHNASVPVNQIDNESTVPADLSRATTYLSKPGLKATFDVNYPDGLMGITNRISGLAVPNEVVRISEVETGIERGEEFGFGFHYVERPDGIYYIIDSTPYEIIPELKNNLTVGQSWNYTNEYGNIVWTVMDMGVDLDLGFKKFNNCLLVMEDNQAVGWQTISYYAPGYGKVMAVSPGGLEYYKMTAVETIDPGVAADTIIKWCPNYKDIKDDRTQSY